MEPAILSLIGVFGLAALACCIAAILIYAEAER